MKRRLVATLGIALCFLLLSCGGPNKAAEGKAAEELKEKPVPGDWIIVRYEGEPDKLNPLISSSTYANYAMYGANSSQVYEFLLAYDLKNWTLTKPMIASAPPDVSPDHLTYVFPIRDGIKWHDGQPLSPEDVLFTFK